MTDLNQIVELGAALDDRRFEGSSIDAGVGTDLDVVFDDDFADL